MSVSSRTDHIQIARAMGIPIYLHFSWLIIFGLIVWTLSTGYMRTGYGGYPVTRGEAGRHAPVDGRHRHRAGRPLPVAIARMAQADTARLLVMHEDRLVTRLTTNGLIRRPKVLEELTGQTGQGPARVRKSSIRVLRP